MYFNGNVIFSISIAVLLLTFKYSAAMLAGRSEVKIKEGGRPRIVLKLVAMTKASYVLIVNIARPAEVK